MVRRVPSTLEVVNLFSVHPVYVSSQAHETLKTTSRNSSSLLNDIHFIITCQQHVGLLDALK